MSPIPCPSPPLAPPQTWQHSQRLPPGSTRARMGPYVGMPPRDPVLDGCHHGKRLLRVSCFPSGRVCRGGVLVWAHGNHPPGWSSTKRARRRSGGLQVKTPLALTRPPPPSLPAHAYLFLPRFEVSCVLCSNSLYFTHIFLEILFKAC